MVEDWLIKTMYATKRRRRTVKSVKTPSKEPPKSNPSKRHRERLNGELDHLASLLPFEQSVISKLDKLSILRLAVSYLRTKSFFQSVLPVRYGMESHLMSRSHLFHEPGFSEGESILQALYGFLFVVTCDGEVFFASRTVEQYLGFHQSDIIHQSVMELIHSEDRDEFKRQLTWNSMLPADKAGLALHDVMMQDHVTHLHRSFTVRFRCLLDNTSGFITLEINGWIRVLHGQGPRCEEPQLALFATCSPFGPLSLFDIPARETTFKTKHKMDFSPVTMDNRGKALFAFSDQELSTRSGYDLIHPDDLNYFSSAHQELIKTGSSGLISYRWQTKHFHWLWLQSSCKVIYKNSKPDFIICTHRQLTEDEGQDLFGKRGNEFKLPYPLLDIDMCTGFGFGEEEISSKSKSSKTKKKSGGNNNNNSNNNNNNNNPAGFNPLSGPATRDCQNTKKRKPACMISGIPAYCSYPASFPAYDGAAAEVKAPESLYPYTGNSFGFENDMYRSQGYGGLTPTVYPSTDPYRLEVDKHGYFIDHRQYQHSGLSYPNNGYADYMSANKYGYDVARYGFDSYSLDLSKRMECGDISQLHSDVRRYTFDYHHPSYGHLDHHSLHTTDRFATSRLNMATLDPVDLRNPTTIFGGNSFMNTVETPCPTPSPCTAPSALKPLSTSSHLLSNKGQSPPKLHKLSPVSGTLEAPPMSVPYEVAVQLPHNSVIKSTRQPEPSLAPPTLSHPLSQSTNDGALSSSPVTKSGWNSCSKSVNCSMGEQTRVASLQPVDSEHTGADLGNSKCPHDMNSITLRSEAQDALLKQHDSHVRLDNKQESPMTGIPVSVVKQSPWLQATNPNNGTNTTSQPGSISNNNNNNNITSHGSSNMLVCDRDWTNQTSEYYSKAPRVIFPEACHTVKQLGLKVFERGDNPLLSFSEMTHTLMSSTH